MNTTQPTAQLHLETAEAGQYLTFLLHGETYALGILSIKEIIGYDHLTEVPMMPDFIRGVINLRGRVVPVVDLLCRFGQGNTAIAKRTSIVIVETRDDSGDGNTAGKVTDIGIIVDAVNEVVDIGADAIEPAPSFGARIRPEFIIGMAKREGHFIVMLAVNKVLAVNEMAALGQALFKQHESP
ncbi:MAG: chemotaxis protein CheW [Methylococcaceae bacterium]